MYQRYRLFEYSLRLVVSLVLTGLLLIVDASAVETTGEIDTLPRTEADTVDMVARLSDAEVRELLLRHLQRSMAGPAEELAARSPWRLSASPVVLEALTLVFQSARSTPQHMSAVIRGIEGENAHPWLVLCLNLLIALVVAFAVARFIGRKGGMLDATLSVSRGAADGVGALLTVTIDAVVGAVGVAIVAASALIAISLLPGLTPGTRAIALGVIWTVSVTRLVGEVARSLLGHQSPANPWAISTQLAGSIARILPIVAAFAMLNPVCTAVLHKAGADPYFTMLITLLASSALILSILWGIVTAKAAMSAGRATDDAPSAGFDGLYRAYWHRLAIAYVLFIFGLAVYNRLAIGEATLLSGLLSFAVILAVPVLDAALRRLAARIISGPKGAEMTSTDAETDTDSVPDLKVEDQSNTYEVALVFSLRWILGIAFVMTMANLWRIDLRLLAASFIGERATTALSQVVVVGLLALIAWRVLKAAVEFHRGTDSDAGESDDAGGTGLSRAQTLLPIITTTVSIALGVLFAMTALSAFGVNIGPLLAGAGVFGLAVGFGAQTLVRDVVSGVFFLVEDAFRMGEYVQIDNIRGSVEKITARSLRLRHHNGPVHTLPYGEIKHITNFSRDYTIMKFDIRVPFESDVEQVRKAIKKVGEQMLEDEEIAKVILEPLKSQGVNRMDDSSFVIRCKFTTLPGQQFFVRRVAYAKIQEVFQQKGIKFAPKRVIVETGSPPAGQKTVDPVTAAAGAAAAQEADTHGNL